MSLPHPSHLKSLRSRHFTLQDIKLTGHHLPTLPLFPLLDFPSSLTKKVHKVPCFQRDKEREIREGADVNKWVMEIVRWRKK